MRRDVAKCRVGCFGTRRDRANSVQQSKEEILLDTSRAFSGFAVKDVSEAASFYRETLGMNATEENGLLSLEIDDDHVILAYPKPDHTPASFTILNFPVDDIDAAVEELTEQGVRFERYDDFDQDERGIVRGDEGPNIAWFTDPSGNILSVLEVS
jgi:catechol 2,3-dioxygenase-like lactoylglutathione lyase family enzyme